MYDRTNRTVPLRNRIGYYLVFIGSLSNRVGGG